MHQATLCPGCGQPKDRAWHSGTAHSWESEEAVCHVCTLQRGYEVAYSRITSTLSPAADQALPLFAWGETTTTPKKPSGGGSHTSAEQGLS